MQEDDPSSSPAHHLTRRRNELREAFLVLHQDVANRKANLNRRIDEAVSEIQQAYSNLHTMTFEYCGLSELYGQVDGRWSEFIRRVEKATLEEQYRCLQEIVKVFEAENM